MYPIILFVTFIFAYLLIGYVTTVVVKVIRKSPRINYRFFDSWYANESENELFTWPLTLAAIATDCIVSLVTAASRIAAWGWFHTLSPDTVATKIVDRNKMLVIREGREAQDG